MDSYHFLLQIYFFLHFLVIPMQGLRSAQRRLDTQREIINHFSKFLPSFDELFDERSWYLFFAILTISSFLIAYLLSRFFTINDVDYDYKNRNKKSGRYPGVQRTQLF
jgi:hypothetical protein